MAVMTVSEYVQRGVLASVDHWHVDTTRSETVDFACADMNEAVEHLRVFAERVTDATSFVEWPDETFVLIKHADRLPDFGRVYACSDPTCECETSDSDAALSDDDFLLSASELDYATLDINALWPGRA